MAILSEAQLKRLKEHKYASEGSSILEHFFQPFWNFVVTLIPLWVAPNLITIFGLFLNAVTASLVILYSPQAKSDDVPGVVLFCCSVGLFLYQTLDAIDGKQARRTGSSSPMGELFDHGCDSVSTCLVTMSIMCAISLGSFKNYLFFVFINNSLIFYVAHWQTYCTGKLIFGKMDVTEVQVETMLSMMVAAFYGPSFFLTQVPFIPYSICWTKCITYFIAVGSMWYFIQGFSKIFAGGCGKNGTTVAQSSVLSPVVPMGIVTACAFYVFKHSGDDIFSLSPCLFMAMFGTCFAKLTCNLVVASMSKSHLDMLDVCMLGPIILACYIYFAVNSWLSLVNISISEYHILWAAFVFSLINFIRYSIGICQEISQDFGIAVFSIKLKKVE